MQEKDKLNLFKQSNLAITGILLIVFISLFLFSYFVFKSEISKTTNYILGSENYLDKSTIPEYTSLARDSLKSKQVIAGHFNGVTEYNKVINLSISNDQGDETLIPINKDQDNYESREYLCAKSDCIELEKKFYYTSEFDLEVRNDFINLPEIDISDIKPNSDIYVEITNEIEERSIRNTSYLIVSRSIDG